MVFLARKSMLAAAGTSFDTTGPTVIITCSQTSPSSASPLNFTFTFNEVVTGFTLGDITITNGTKSNFAGSGAVYTCDITPDNVGSVTVDVSAGVCTDNAGNTNTAAAQFVMSVFLASISPTIGNTIVTDGNMEAANVTSWTSVATPTTKEKSGTQKHGGAQSLHVISDTTGEGAQEFLSGTANQWYQVDSWGYVAIGDLTMTGSFGLVLRKDISSASWSQLFGTDLNTGAGPRIIFRSNGVAASEFYIDDVAINPLTMATCFKTARTDTSTATVSAKVTATDQCKIGVVANLDSITTPLNYVLAVVDANNKAWLWQISNGVYTAKINGTAITYVADKLIEIRHTAPTTYQLWYNGAKVGADQTINDSNINNNTTYCQFSTYSGNTFSFFFTSGNIALTDSNASHQWRLNDNLATTTVIGSQLNGEMVGGNTSDVQTTLYGNPTFHLNGTTQYVKVNITPNLMRADEISHLWTKHPSNPVLSDGSNSVKFGQLVAKPGGGWYWFGVDINAVARWESTDLITWTNRTQVMAFGAPGSWDSAIQGVMTFRKPNGDWVMFYRGDGGPSRPGMATSTDGETFTRVDNGGVDDGLFTKFGNNYDAFCVILVGTRYYVYAGGDPSHGHTSIYYSDDDLQTFTRYGTVPIFENGFCGYVWKHGSYYYIILPRDLGASLTGPHEHGLALYRCTVPTFDYGIREFLGYACINDQSYDNRYFDVPSMPFTDIYRTTYAPEFGDTLYTMYSGNLSAIKQALAYTSFSALEALPVIPETATELYHHETRTFTFNIQFDTITVDDVIFSIASSTTDSSPVQFVVIKGTGIYLYLGGGYRSTSFVPSINTPYQVVIVDDVGQTKAYVNSVLVGTFTYENPSTDGSYLYIGEGAGTRSFDGYVWDFRIYSSALSATQVEKLYTTGSII